MALNLEISLPFIFLVIGAVCTGVGRAQGHPVTMWVGVAFLCLFALVFIINAIVMIRNYRALKNVE